MHVAPVTAISYNSGLDFVVSADRKGIIEYWGTSKIDYQLPKIVKFSSKLDTDLFEFAKLKTYPISISLSPDGTKFAVVSSKIYYFISYVPNISQIHPSVRDTIFLHKEVMEEPLCKIAQFVLETGLLIQETGVVVVHKQTRH